MRGEEIRAANSGASPLSDAGYTYSYSTGMTTCSPTQREPRPRSSAARATRAMFDGALAGGEEDTHLHHGPVSSAEARGAWGL